MDKFLSTISIFLAPAIVAYGIAETTKDLQMTTDMVEQQRQTLLSPTAGGRPIVENQGQPSRLLVSHQRSGREVFVAAVLPCLSSFEDPSLFLLFHKRQ
jgi:hypothetical protein